MKIGVQLTGDSGEFTVFVNERVTGCLLFIVQSRLFWPQSQDHDPYRKNG